MTQYIFDIDYAEDSDVRKTISIVEGADYIHYLAQIIYKTLYCSWLTQCLNFQPVIKSLQALRRAGFDFIIHDHPLYNENGVVIKYLDNYVSVFMEKNNLYVNINSTLASDVMTSNNNLRSLTKVG